MSRGDAKPESLAAQAAAWVPPWERRRSPAPGQPPLSDPGEPDGAAAHAVPVDDPDGAAAHAVPVDDPDGSLDNVAVQSTDATLSVAVDPAGTGISGGSVDIDDGDDDPDTAPEGIAVDDPDGPAAAGNGHDALAGGPAGTVAGGGADGVPSGPPADQPPVEPPVGADLRAAIEAILLVVDEPVAEEIIAQVLGAPAGTVAAALDDLAGEYTAGRRGFELRRAAGGWRLYTRSEFAPYVERFVLDGQQLRLTQAALETLAVVAYKQPVSRSRIGAIRGVNSDGVVRTLVTRGLIEETGTEPETGAYLYRTTPLFLEKLGLNSVDELPPLAPFLPDDVDEVADAQR